MANYQTLKTAIQQVVKTNGNNEITGALLQQSLLAMINSLGSGYQFMGIATPTTNPGTPDQRVFYIANGKGIYANFSSLEVTEDEIIVLYWDSLWHKVATGIASNEKLTELGHKVDSLSLGKFYGFYESSSNLPTAAENGYAYVGNGGLYNIYNAFDGTWIDSGVKASKDNVFVTPEMFGAKGDGLTDDTDAIQRAIDANIEGANIVYFISKSYLVKKGGLKLRNNVALISENKSVIKTKSEAINAEDAYIFIVGLSVADSDELYAKEGDWLHNIVIDGLTFDQSEEQGIDESTMKGLRPIYIYGVSNCFIKNCRFILKGGNAIGIFRNTTRNIVLSNNIIENLAKSYDYDQSAIYVQGSYVQITNNNILDERTPESIAPMRGGIEIHGYGFNVVGNVINNVQSAFNITCYRGQQQRTQELFNIVSNNSINCEIFVSLWNQQKEGIEAVTLGYIQISNNIVECTRVCRTVYGEAHLSKIESIHLSNNIFYAKKITSDIQTSTIANSYCAILFYFRAEAKDIVIRQNVFKSFCLGLVRFSSEANVQVSNIYITDNIFEECYSIESERLKFFDYVYLFTVGDNISNTKITGNIINIKEDADFVSMPLRDRGNDTIFEDNKFSSNYMVGMLSTAPKLVSSLATPTSGTFNNNDIVVTPESILTAKAGTIKSGVINGVLHYLPNSYIEIDDNNTVDCSIGDYISFKTPTSTFNSLRVVAIFGKRLYITGSVGTSLFGTTEEISDFAFVKPEFKLSDNVKRSNNAMPSNPQRGQNFFSTANNKPMIYDGYNWCDYGGIRADFKKKGSSSERPTDGTYLHPGYVFFDTGLGKCIFFKENRSGYRIWVDESGADVSYKRYGLSTQRPVSFNYSDPVPVGFQFFDTTLNKPIYWMGTKWVDATGADV